MVSVFLNHKPGILRGMCTLFISTVRAIYTLHVVYTLHSEYTLHAVYTLHGVYTLHMIYTLPVVYTFNVEYIVPTVSSFIPFGSLKASAILQ